MSAADHKKNERQSDTSTPTPAPNLALFHLPMCLPSHNDRDIIHRFLGGPTAIATGAIYATPNIDEEQSKEIILTKGDIRWGLKDHPGRHRGGKPQQQKKDEGENKGENEEECGEKQQHEVAPKKEEEEEDGNRLLTPEEFEAKDDNAVVFRHQNSLYRSIINFPPYYVPLDGMSKVCVENPSPSSSSLEKIAIPNLTAPADVTAHPMHPQFISTKYPYRYTALPMLAGKVKVANDLVLRISRKKRKRRHPQQEKGEQPEGESEEEIKEEDLNVKVVGRVLRTVEFNEPADFAFLSDSTPVELHRKQELSNFIRCHQSRKENNVVGGTPSSSLYQPPGLIPCLSTLEQQSILDDHLLKNNDEKKLYQKSIRDDGSALLQRLHCSRFPPSTFNNPRFPRTIPYGFCDDPNHLAGKSHAVHIIDLTSPGEIPKEQPAASRKFRNEIMEEKEQNNIDKCLEKIPIWDQPHLRRVIHGWRGLNIIRAHTYIHRQGPFFALAIRYGFNPLLSPENCALRQRVFINVRNPLDSMRVWVRYLSKRKDIETLLEKALFSALLQQHRETLARTKEKHGEKDQEEERLEAESEKIPTLKELIEAAYVEYFHSVNVSPFFHPLLPSPFEQQTSSEGKQNDGEGEKTPTLTCRFPSKFHLYAHFIRRGMGNFQVMLVEVQDPIFARILLSGVKKTWRPPAATPTATKENPQATAGKGVEGGAKMRKTTSGNERPPLILAVQEVSPDFDIMSGWFGATTIRQALLYIREDLNLFLQQHIFPLLAKEVIIQRKEGQTKDKEEGGEEIAQKGGQNHFHVLPELPPPTFHRDATAMMSSILSPSSVDVGVPSLLSSASKEDEDFNMNAFQFFQPEDGAATRMEMGRFHIGTESEDTQEGDEEEDEEGLDGFPSLEAEEEWDDFEESAIENGEKSHHHHHHHHHHNGEKKKKEKESHQDELLWGLPDENTSDNSSVSSGDFW